MSGSSTKKWFASTSAYAQLTPVQKSQIVVNLQASGELELLRKAFRHLVALYPECPFNFLFEGDLPLSSEADALVEFKKLVSKLFYRFERPATLMQADAVYIAFSCDMLYVQKDSLLANLPAISRYPDTEESMRVAAGVRAMMNGMFGMDSHYEKSSPWPKYFWYRGLELEPCDYSEIDKVFFQ